MQNYNSRDGGVPSWANQDFPDRSYPEQSSYGSNPNTQESAFSCQPVAATPDSDSEILESMKQIQLEMKAISEQMVQMSRDWTQQSTETKDQISELKSSVACLEDKISSMNKDDSLKTRLEERMDNVSSAMETLTARSMDVMRQTMEFTNSSSRRWTKELEEYRSLFRESVYDEIWKELGGIYINIVKHLNRKKDPSLTKEVEFCALEPIQEMLEENGVTILISKAGQKRSFKKTKSKNQVPTGDPEKDTAVANSILPGFERGNICLIPELVESYVYKEGYQDIPQTDPKTSVDGIERAEPNPSENPVTGEEERPDETIHSLQEQDAAITDVEGQAVTPEQSSERNDTTQTETRVEESGKADETADNQNISNE